MTKLNDYDNYDPYTQFKDILHLVKEVILKTDPGLENKNNLDAYKELIIENLYSSDDLENSASEVIFEYTEDLFREIYEDGYDTGYSEGHDAGYIEGHDNGYSEGVYNKESELNELQNDYDELQNDYDEIQEENGRLEDQVIELSELVEKQKELKDLDLDEVRQSILDDLRAELESSSLTDVF